MELRRVYEIIADTEQKILDETGIACQLRPLFKNSVKGRWLEIMQIVSDTVGIAYENYASPTRVQYVVWMKHIATYLIKHCYPQMSYSELCKLMGWQHHTTAIHAINQVDERITTRDDAFLDFYLPAEKAVLEWNAKRLNKQDGK